MSDLRRFVSALREPDRPAVLRALEGYGSTLDAATRTGSQGDVRAAYAELGRLGALTFTLREGVPASGATEEILAMAEEIEAMLASPHRLDARLGRDPYDD